MNRTENTARRAWWPVGVGPVIAVGALVVVAVVGSARSMVVCGVVLALVVGFDAYRYRAGDRPFWRRG